MRQYPDTKTGRMRAFLATVDFGASPRVTRKEVIQLAEQFHVSEGYAEHVLRGAGISIGQGFRRGPS